MGTPVPPSPYRTWTRSVQAAAFLHFVALAPLAHLHQNASLAADGHVPHRMSTFHAHFDGHEDRGHHHDHQSDGDAEAVGISHGNLVSPRQVLPEPPLVVAARVAVQDVLHEIAHSLANPSQAAHSPPVFSHRPVRAPPSFA